MSTELSTTARARIHAALADPARLAIIDHLAVTDTSPGDMGRLLDLPTNLVAHHLGVLESAGLITRTRSEGDRRRTYLRLVPDALSRLLHPHLVNAPRVVFVCTHNSARSQLAAATLASRTTVPTASAGTEPADRVHPRAVRIGRRHGLDLRTARPAHVRDVLRDGDLVISVCDNANENLPIGGARLHWSVPDPARVDTDAAFETAYAEIADRIDCLVSILSGGSR
jgi:ArsR family transcriptional regulator, arsenate/arsenite/antimonite-responsive transcriptional repressor / arsenate reductase (thioredoxin)